MTIGQPSDTATMNLESGRSVEWVSVSFADAPVLGARSPTFCPVCFEQCVIDYGWDANVCDAD